MIKNIVDEAVATTEASMRTITEPNARLAATLRGTPAQLEKMLALADQLQARERMRPAVDAMIASLSDLRQAIDETIIEIERLVGAVTS